MHSLKAFIVEQWKFYNALTFLRLIAVLKVHNVPLKLASTILG